MIVLNYNYCNNKNIIDTFLLLDTFFVHFVVIRRIIRFSVEIESNHFCNKSFKIDT